VSSESAGDSSHCKSGLTINACRKASRCGRLCMTYPAPLVLVGSALRYPHGECRIRGSQRYDRCHFSRRGSGPKQKLRRPREYRPEPARHDAALERS
jgi:hypothetical protein